MTEVSWEGPRYGSPEWQAGELAAKVLAGEREAERARREAHAGEISAQVTSAPGMPPGVAERRAWALKECSAGVTEVIASPDVSPPVADIVWRMPDGSVRVARSASPSTWLIHPGNAAQMEVWFEQRQHDAEDLRLIAFYGAESCVREGIVAAADAERLAKPKAPAGPGHYPGDLLRTVG